MPFVERDDAGRVIALRQQATPDCHEEVPGRHPDVLAFLDAQGVPASVQQALAESDQALARVTEDLIGVLVDKNLICFTDLPPVVQQKLLSREQLRAQLGSPTASPLSDDDTL